MNASPRKILVRGPNWVGDVVMATPVLRSLRSRFAEAEIHLALKPYCHSLVRAGDGVDRVVSVVSGGGLAGAWRRGAAIRRENYDLAILLTNSFGSALDAFLGRVPRRVGYRGDGRSWMLTDGIPFAREGGRRRPIPMVDFYYRLIEGLGCRLDDRRYVLEVSSEDEAAAEAFWRRHGLDGAKEVVGVNPGAAFGSSKLWFAERFAASADAIARERGSAILLLGGPGEEDLLDRIASIMEEPCVNSARDIVPLGPLKAVIARLALLIANDTGPRAIGQAMGVPTVVVMGSTHPGWTDANNERAAVIRHDVDCGPCHEKICPLDHRCMDLIQVDEVTRAALGLLARHST